MTERTKGIICYTFTCAPIPLLGEIAARMY